MSTATTPATVDADDLSMIAGGYLRIIADGQVQSASDSEITFACAAAELLKDEAGALAALVTARRVGADMVPYFFSAFGFRVAAAALNHPPREAIEKIKTTLELAKAEIRETINEALRRNETINGEPI